MLQKSSFLVDGKPVRKFLFARLSSLSPHPVLAQVEAFNVDHALKRLAEIFPQVKKSAWTMIEELDPEHDVGKLGSHHPLNPLVVRGNLTRQ